MSFAERLQTIIRDRANLIECANRCAEAYAKGAGYSYTPFGADKPEEVAQNYAGLQAVVSGITLMCSQEKLALDRNGPVMLKDIASGECGEIERDILHRLANATWGAGQPFRTDKGPLGRADRVNVFDLLPPEEVAKDWVQIKAAAKFLMEKLNAA